VKEKRVDELKGVCLIALGLIVLAGLVSFNHFDLKFYTSHPNIIPKNLVRAFGAYLAGTLLFLFGWAGYLIPLIILFYGIRTFNQQRPYISIPRILGILVLVLSLSSLLGMFSLKANTAAFRHAGFFGFIFSNFISAYFGELGGYIIFATFAILSFMLVTEVLLSAFALNIIDRLKPAFKPLSAFTFKRRKAPVFIKPFTKENNSKNMVKAVIPTLEKLPKIVVAEARPKVQMAALKPQAQAESTYKPQPPMREGGFQLPSLDLLDSPPPLEVRQIKEDLTGNARILEETLGDFNISVKVTDIERGPIITRYELEPAPGVKLNRIVALSDDIALTMKAQSVRIVAPIPGKGRVGVEVPNTQSSFVYLKEVLMSSNFKEMSSKLALALGKDITGAPVIADLTEMPHLLIAGATGSGKTVCVNSIILSMLFRATPDELKFLMIDPKMVELTPFNGLPHLLCPVVTDAKKVSHALNWVVNEMEERYRLLAKAGARNIDAYNQKEEKIPYIIVIIDELADLMMVSRDQIETAITRLAQLSRAVGIHLVLATQRPSVDVITGVIKANFPARISFKVASKVDSRTVLDANGADKLLGKGDMLFLRPGESRLIRAQGALVSDREIERMVEFYRLQGEPVFNEEILKEQHKSSFINGSEKDELYEEAVRIIMEGNQASVSILQRRMRFGYTRAARIIDMMEQEGLVGPFEGSKPRKILVDREPWLEKNLLGKEGQEQ